MVTIDDFSKLELKVGTILEAEELPESEKLIKLKVDLGPAPDGAEQDIRQILAGINLASHSSSGKLDAIGLPAAAIARSD